ncbi:hypothetical protein VII00023_05642 [Vibrio ichthyoenteri ATCC 700023]|uniref:Uncharacterized protein n=1 Tax=Vibrio ichthyoenteri ATCC 700023 TaxID=870968 RepID=F9S6C2_9VIBR|nr:hypothetical protein VII00023_05642 [Vibrio ichthyoenteri ATCC 700023]
MFYVKVIIPFVFALDRAEAEESSFEENTSMAVASNSLRDDSINIFGVR